MQINSISARYCCPKPQNTSFGEISRPRESTHISAGDGKYYRNASLALEALMAKFSDMMYEDKFEKKIFIRNSAMGDYNTIREALDRARGFDPDW